MLHLILYTIFALLILNKLETKIEHVATAIMHIEVIHFLSIITKQVVHLILMS